MTNFYACISVQRMFIKIYRNFRLKTSQDGQTVLIYSLVNTRNFIFSSFRICLYHRNINDKSIYFNHCHLNYINDSSVQMLQQVPKIDYSGVKSTLTRNLNLRSDWSPASARETTIKIVASNYSRIEFSPYFKHSRDSLCTALETGLSASRSRSMGTFD